ncbi:MAG: hypothetical protein A3G34_14155 [Candidatus Lindowbacteria bacterium RIFCSPLOWO2_12_FULL_62_27]|nr:MAG: hypothetical protein A3I06_15860 [Candidatus Lindowbacteria bacterium RIFCSPLOWO2_02_FULL_62_12]OGH62709.1 MAG: hypothetical protein A3G34_14155 [Candidatus Lindowbacteria bacterium RIFCSPLOWO2_12_FULL_62_27]
MNHPETSIVIRAYNEERHLPALLEAIRRQTYRDFEIIVVDSGSIDKTRDIAAAHADKVLRIHPHDFTFGYSLNRGIQAAAGRFIAMASAHTLPAHPDWLGRLIEPLRTEPIAMVFGRQFGSERSKYSEQRDLAQTFTSRREILRTNRLIGNNANAAIRRDLWEQHPFRENLPGIEDLDFAKYWIGRGYQVVYEPEAPLYHIHEETWRQVRRRYYREALAAKWIGLKRPADAAIDTGLELIRAFRDIGRAILEPVASADAKPGWIDRSLEILLFRANKGIGTVAGLLDGAAMETETARENMFYDRHCQAVVIRGPGQAALEEIEIPRVNPGDALIRVAYEGVCATDVEILNGSLGYYKTGTARYPIVPGHELSGRIVSVGPNVQHLQEGDRVVVECIQSCGHCEECRRSNWIGCPDRAELGVIRRNGGYSKYVVVPGRFVHRLPPETDLRAACLCEPLAVALKGLRRLSRCWPAEPAVKRCAVIGAGPLGHLCARVLAHRGHAVTAFDRDPQRLACFAGSPVHLSENLDGLRGFDAVIEATGNPDALDRVLRSSSAGSTVLLLGLPYAGREFNFEQVVAYDKTVVGSVGSGAEDFREAIDLAGHLDLAPFLTSVLPLSRFREAWENFKSPRRLKVLLEVNPDVD